MQIPEAARAIGIAEQDVREVKPHEGGVEIVGWDGTRRLLAEDGWYALDDHFATAGLRRWEPKAGDDESENEPEDELEEPPHDEVRDLAVEVPEGTVNEVLTWVGDDHDRAVAALHAELQRDTPRKGLVTDLEKRAEG